MNDLIGPNRGISTKFQPSGPLVRLGEMFMTERTLLRFKLDLWELVEKYREDSRLDLAIKRHNEIFPITFLTVLEKYPIWRKVMWEGKR